MSNFGSGSSSVEFHSGLDLPKILNRLRERLADINTRILALELIETGQANHCGRMCRRISVPASADCLSGSVVQKTVENKAVRSIGTL
jgi:hypothetical protein